MTIHLLASELAAAVPELQRDSIVNNEKYFEGKLREFLDATRCSPPAGEHGHMTAVRFNQLMEDDGVLLSEKEMADGWHFCFSMDGLLANYNDPDGDCFCELNKSRKR